MGSWLFALQVIAICVAMWIPNCHPNEWLVPLLLAMLLAQGEQK